MMMKRIFGGCCGEGFVTSSPSPQDNIIKAKMKMVNATQASG